MCYGVKVTIAYPPDTDTPGFAVEEKGKPKETSLISESGGLYQPSVVAKQILNDALVIYYNLFIQKQSNIVGNINVSAIFLDKDNSLWMVTPFVRKSSTIYYQLTVY